MSSTSSSTTAPAPAAVPSVDDLYKLYGLLADAKEEAGSKHESTYLQIVSGTKGGVKEKQLASQFIARFFKHFAKHAETAIDAIFDLCEDEDITIRKSAIKDLSVLCKDCGAEHLTRIADILTQLLQTNDQQESTQVQATLVAVLKQSPKETLNAIFNQINTAELEEIRKRAIKFLVAKVPAMIEPATATGGVISKDVEELLVKHVKQVLTDVDAEEFTLFIRLLTALPSMSTLTGRQELVNVIMAQSELDKPFEATDAERIMILLACIQQAIPLFSKNVQSNKFVKGFLDSVIPIFGKLQDETVKFEILKAFAELCSHYNTANTAINSQIQLGGLFDLLIAYLPKPSEVQEAANGGESQDEAKFNFSFVECLLYSFHALGRLNADFLAATGDDEATKERLRDFRLRLQYFAKGTQNYIKELRSTLAAKPTENDENNIRRVALRVTSNIDLLIKDFFHNPPSYKAVITLSWKTPEPAAKRPAEAASAADAGNKKKTERGIYAPPSGRYTVNNSFSSFGQQSDQQQAKKRTYSNGSNQSNRANRY